MRFRYVEGAVLNVEIGVAVMKRRFNSERRTDRFAVRAPVLDRPYVNLEGKELDAVKVGDRLHRVFERHRSISGDDIELPIARRRYRRGSECADEVVDQNPVTPSFSVAHYR